MNRKSVGGYQRVRTDRHHHVQIRELRAWRRGLNIYPALLESEDFTGLLDALRTGRTGGEASRQQHDHAQPPDSQAQACRK